MKQEEKKLLLKDLCGRLPYGVKVVSVDSNGETISRVYTLHTLDAADFISNSEEAIIPYLRPMSSMTEEEKCEFNSYYNMFNNNPVGLIDWLNKKMFAYRIIDGKDMFELGLALEAPEGMYNIKEK